MLTNTEKQFSILFCIIVLLELLTGSVESLTNAHYIIKPAIVSSLIFLFLKGANQLETSIKRLTLAALICSVLGDIFLMFVSKSEHFFTIGLIAFLLAHLMYISVFLKHKNKDMSITVFVILLLLYASGLFYVLKDGLGVMLIPVLIYMFVILSMATSAYVRKHKISSISYKLVLIGAILFMISDSILALHKFYKPIPWSNISIMLSYALAQFLIVFGILKINVTNTEV